MCPGRGSQMLLGQEAVGTNPESRHVFWGGHPWEDKPGGRTQRCHLGQGTPEVFGAGQGGAGALWCTGAHTHSESLSRSWACPSAPGMSLSPPRLWASPHPSSPGGQRAGGPPHTATVTRAKQPPQFPWSQCAALTLSRRLLLLNCANEMTLIKAIAPQLGDGCCSSAGLPSRSPAPARGRTRVPAPGTQCRSQPWGIWRDPISPARARFGALALGRLQPGGATAQTSKSCPS